MQFSEEFRKEMQKKIESRERFLEGKEMLRGRVIDVLEEIGGFVGKTPLEEVNEVLEELSEFEVLYDVELMSRYLDLYRLTLYLRDECEEPVPVGYVEYTMKPHSEEVEIENVVIWEDEEEEEEE